MAAHFAPYRMSEGIVELGLRELRTLDAFFAWAEAQAIDVPGVQDFLAFTSETHSTRQLENLRTVFDRLTPEGAAVRMTIRNAIRAKRPRSRICDRRSRDEIVAAAHFQPYRHLAALGTIALEDLRALDRFLAYADQRRIEIPTVADFLAFAGDKGSSRLLRSLKAALDRLIPGNPAVLLTLQEAIRHKAPRPTRAERTSRPPAQYRVPLSELPDTWQDALAAMRRGECLAGRPALAESTVKATEEVLREYAQVMTDAGLPVEITIDGIRRLGAARAKRSHARKHQDYTDQGNRPATQHTAVLRLRAFAERIGCDPLLICAIRAHEKHLRRNLRTAVPLKFGKLEGLPDLAETWRIAQGLLNDSHAASQRRTRLRLLNEAAILALWTLLPLRLGDSQLRWGNDIYWSAKGYRVDINTQKADVPLQGVLHPTLSPFLDALVLNGMDPAYLEAMRADALARELPLLRDTTGRMLAARYPSRVWTRHMGAGAHISRARVHTELGQLGPEGVEAALALNAQINPRSRHFYQGQAVAAAMVRRGQVFMKGLLDTAARSDDAEEHLQYRTGR